jgi:hypothetical protein
VISRLARLPSASPLFSVLVAVNLGLSLPIVYRVIFEPMPPLDWHVLTEAGRDVMAGVNPYAGTTPDSFRWSPLLAYLFWAIEPIGNLGWTLITLPPILLLRDARLILLFATAWPLWRDVEIGVSFLFVPLLLLLALRGSRTAALGFAVVAFLIPRPLMLPPLVWLLWKRPELRLPTLLLGAALGIGALMTGWAGEWADKLVAVGGDVDRSRIYILAELGPAWIAMLALGAWLTWHGRVGLAGLAVSPYWVPSYLLMAFVELGRGRSTPKAHHREPS